MPRFQFLRKILGICGVALTRRTHLEKLEIAYRSHAHPNLELISRLGYSDCTKIIQDLKNSKSQHSQDMVALSLSGFKSNGFFVEFGATNGVTISNTFLLEKFYGWSGILAEPARVWHEALKLNRSAKISYQCVWSESGMRLPFIETQIEELSTIRDFSSHDLHADLRKSGSEYLVETISLNDLLKQNNAPRKIDYMSIDTEGSELEILEHFDFSMYEIEFVSVEHNYTKNREQIFSLLDSKGYTRIFQDFSFGDDWYVRSKP